MSLWRVLVPLLMFCTICDVIKVSNYYNRLAEPIHNGSNQQEVFIHMHRYICVTGKNSQHWWTESLNGDTQLKIAGWGAIELCSVETQPSKYLQDQETCR